MDNDTRARLEKALNDARRRDAHIVDAMRYMMSAPIRREEYVEAEWRRVKKPLALREVNDG